MADKFYAKGPGNNGYIKNLEVLDFNPWNGKSGVFQMQVYKTAEGKYYLYGSCFGGTQNGVLIADITDPEHTRFVKHLQLLDPEEYPTTSTPKIQGVGKSARPQKKRQNAWLEGEYPCLCDLYSGDCAGHVDDLRRQVRRQQQLYYFYHFRTF